jgi:hypothetical protein
MPEREPLAQETRHLRGHLARLNWSAVPLSTLRKMKAVLDEGECGRCAECEAPFRMQDDSEPFRSDRLPDLPEGWRWRRGRIICPTCWPPPPPESPTTPPHTSPEGGGHSA